MYHLIYSAVLVLIFSACDTPNHAATNRRSTAPMSDNPTTTLPGTGARGTYNRVEATTGTAPANEALPEGGNAAGTDSTTRR